MTHDDIKNFAGYVKISVDSSVEAEEIITKMESVLAYIDQIQKVEIDTIYDKTNISNPELRPDIVIGSNFTDDFMNNVPLSENGYVKVPRVLNTD